MRTITEADIAITTIESGSARYRLDARTEATRRVIPLGRLLSTRAEAVQERADIIDEIVGSARVGDVVRVGASAKTYKVQATGDRAVIFPTEYSTPGAGRSRRVDYDRLHVVRADR